VNGEDTAINYIVTYRRGKKGQNESVEIRGLGGRGNRHAHTKNLTFHSLTYKLTLPFIWSVLNEKCNKFYSFPALPLV
jgi:hypothetical protein